jgi:hypothetical protein
VEAEQVEPGPYNITGPQVVLEQDSVELVKRYFGEGTESRWSTRGAFHANELKGAGYV